MSKLLYIKDSYLVARFAYDADLVETVKAIPERRYSPASRVWFWPATPSNLRAVIGRLEPLGFTRDMTLTGYMEDLEQRKDMSRSLKGGAMPGLYPFQVTAVEFARKAGYRVLIADEMGTGKTIEAIASVIDAGKYPVLVICPSSVKRHWEQHVREWDGGTVQVFEGRDFTVAKADWYVANYDILDDGRLAGLAKTVIVDESHYIKNPKAKRTDQVTRIAKGAKVVLCLDGTPILNRPKDLFTVLNLLRPDLYPKFFPFGLKFCKGTKTPFGWDFDGASNLEDLAGDLRGTCMIRRTKEDVLKDLPAKTRSFLPIDIDLEGYAEHEKIFMDWLKEQNENPNRAIALLRVGEMRRYVCEQKFKECLNWCRDFLESGRSLVVFTHHKIYADRFANALEGELYTGDIPHAARDKAVEKFQSKGNRVIVLTLDAGGEGITLHAAQDTLFFEMAWNASKQRQAEDRIHRIGQKGAATCYYPYAPGTVEEEIIDLLQWKAETSDRGLSDLGNDAFSDFLASRLRKAKGKKS